MKKYLALFGAVVLVMALASPSLAQFKSWGHMEFQTVWEIKPDFNTGQAWQQNSVTGATDRDQNWKQIAERFRFFLQYGDPKTVRAVIGFEADSTNWGEKAATTPGPGNHMGVYRTDQVQLEIKWGYLEFVIPNTPLTVSAGLQGFYYGGRLFMNNDAPGVKLTADFAPHSIQLFWWRQNDDELKYTYNVNDTYGINWEMKKQLFNIYAYFAYKNDLYSGGTNYSDHPWWLGVGAGFRPGNFDFSGQFVYVGGKRDYTTMDDVDYRAWAGELAAKYQIGPGMFVGLEGYYSTGNDADDTSKSKMYQYPTGSEAESIFGNDRTVFFFMNASQMGYYHERQLDPSGMWYGRANFEYSPLAWLRFNVNYLYLGDTSKGTPGVGKIVNSPIGAYQGEDRDKIGQELNLITTFKIYKSFDYNVGLGVFFPGDVYDIPGKDADTAYAINSKMIYAF